MTKKIIKFEILGAVFSILFGSALHFVYEWSGYKNITALIAAVNESTWEHLKLGFWPLLFWAVFEYFVFAKKIKNFFFAKFVTLSVFCLSVPFLFYTYTAILGTNLLPLDISTFVIGIILGQYVGFKIIKLKKDLKLEKIGLILILIIIIKFLSFSFFPPHNFIFKDPISGGYGIIKK